MAGRILTLQRQVRELGRLRAGLTETRVKDGREISYPTSSKTWILTSANRDYLDAAAQLWGGEVTEWQPVGNGPKAWRVITNTPVIDAILPPGDPLSQHQEMWSRGGCQRRCDGERELLTDQPCLCRAEHGEDFHEQKQGTVCDIHTRLNVFLPDLPDIGVWRAETKGFWPANHIAGYVDMIKGQVGPNVLVPVRLRIEPRTKVKAGKTSQFIEIVVELRSRASFAEILNAPDVLAIGGGPERAAIGAGPAPTTAAAAPAAVGPGRATPAQWRDRFAQATTLDELRAMWTPAGQDEALDEETRKAFWEAKGRIDGRSPAWAEQPVDEAPAAEPVDGEAEPDRDAVWTQVLTVAATKGWNLAAVTERLHAATGKAPADADGWALQLFLDAVNTGQVA